MPEPLIKGLDIPHYSSDAVTENDKSLANRIIAGYTSKKQIFLKVRIPFVNQSYSSYTDNYNYVTFELTNAFEVVVSDRVQYSFQFSCENYTNAAILSNAGYGHTVVKDGRTNIGFIQIECAKNGDNIESFRMLGDYLKIYKPMDNNLYINENNPYEVGLPINVNTDDSFAGPLVNKPLNGKGRIFINTASENIQSEDYAGITIIGGTGNRLSIKNSTVANFPGYNKSELTRYYTIGKSEFHANQTTFNALCCVNRNREYGYNQKSEKSSVFKDDPLNGGSIVFINNYISENDITTILDITINEYGKYSANAEAITYSFHLGALGYDPNSDSGDYIHVEQSGENNYYFANRYFTKDTKVMDAVGVCQGLFPGSHLKTGQTIQYLILRVNGGGQTLQAVNSSDSPKNYSIIKATPGGIYFEPFTLYTYTALPGQHDFYVYGNIRIYLKTPLKALHGGAYGNTHV
jgi:hypothetical protein